MTLSVPVSNRYDPLTNLEQQNNNNVENTSSISNVQQRSTKKIKPPPPIILKVQHIKEKYKQFIENIKKKKNI